MYLYLKALHIIFVVTWFAGLFYMVRLFIYNTEAGEKSAAECSTLRNQFLIMQRRLWYGITWPSAIATTFFGGWMWLKLGETQPWLLVKLCFIVGLLLYHLSLQVLFQQQKRGILKFSSYHLRLWNEVATIFLIAIVFLAVVKQQISALWGLLGLLAFVFLIVGSVGIYKKLRG